MTTIEHASVPRVSIIKQLGQSMGTFGRRSGTDGQVIRAVMLFRAAAGRCTARCARLPGVTRLEVVLAHVEEDRERAFVVFFIL